MTLTLTPELDAVVKQVLAHPEAFPWTLQGFGMLRCDLDGRDYRLHVWDRRFRTDNVSDIHNHPWDLESLVMSGQITDFQYDKDQPMDPRQYKHWGVKMQPGPLTGQEDREEPFSACLEITDTSTYERGHVYSRLHNELHATQFKTGTVTLVSRTNRIAKPDGTDEAQVYWPKSEGNRRVTAAPRPATIEEIRDICTVALAVWGE